MGAVTRRAGGLPFFRELDPGKGVNWNCTKGMAMFLDLLFIMTQKTQFVPGLMEKKVRVRTGMGVMATGTLTIFKGFMLNRKVCQLPYLLVAQQAHLPLGQSKHILLISTVRAVANCADTGSQRPVNVVLGKFRPFSLVAPEAQFRSGGEQFISLGFTHEIVARGATSHCDGTVYIIFLGQLLVTFQTGLGDHHETLT